MTGPTNSSPNRTWLLISVSLISLLVVYLLSFGPLLYVSGKTGIEYKPWFKHSIGVVYTPHLWCMTRSESYYDYGWWWYSLARPAEPKTPWIEWKERR